MADDSRYDALDFHITKNSRHQQRGRFRVATHGLSLHLDDVAQTFDIRDLSSSGCSLCAPAALLTVNRIFNADLCIGNTSYLVGLKLKVIRHIAHDNIACFFQTLSHQQEFALDKLLLEIQKRSISTHATRIKREKN
jgi:hypothetical protein